KDNRLMAVNILMPALSPTMETGNLARWLKKEGDAVKAGDVIAEIETDKATMEYEAVDEGALAKIVVPAGTADVPVDQVIAILAEEGEDVSAAASSPQGAKAEKPKSGAKEKAEPGKPEQSDGKAESQPGAGSDKRVEAAAARAEGERVFASPLARRLAKD